MSDGTYQNMDRNESARSSGIPKGPAAIPESSSTAPPPGAETEPAPVGAGAKIKASLTISAFFAFLVCMSMMGTVLVWFQVDFINNHPTPNGFIYAGLRDLGAIAFTLTLTVAGFALSVCPNFFIPTTHAGPLKRFCLFMLLGYVDMLLCMTRYLYKYYDPTNQSVDYRNQLQTMRCGCVLVLLALLPAFFIAFLLPGGSGGRLDAETAKKGLMSARGVVSAVAAIFMTLASILEWAVKEPCDYITPAITGEGYYLRIVSGLLIAILLVTTVLQDDKGTQDVLLYFMISQVVTTFATEDISNWRNSSTQKNFKDLVLAGNWLFFFATIIYMFGMIMVRAKVYREINRVPKRDGGGAGKVGMKEKVQVPATLALVALTLLTVVSAIMMISWGPKDQGEWSIQQYQAVYLACLGFVVVAFGLLSQLLNGFHFLSTVGLMIAFNLVPALGAYIVAHGFVGSVATLNTTSYFRAGAILQLLCIILVQFITLANVPKKRIDEFLSQPEEDGAPPRQGPSSTMVFFLWSLAACYSWQQTTTFYWPIPRVAQVIFPVIIIVGTLDLFGRTNAEVQRVVYLQCCYMITNPALWPLMSIATATFGKVFILLASAITVGLYSWFNPGDHLASFHAENDTNTSLRSVPSERGSLLATQASGAQGGTFEA